MEKFSGHAYNTKTEELSVACNLRYSIIYLISHFDVTLYNAIGDGITDDTAAFVQAWGDLCADISEHPTLIIPSDKTFLIHCVVFAGPCKSSSSSILIKLLGDITAPKSLVGWESCDTQGHLMYFRSVQGLTIAGPGQIDGQGSIWWGDGDVKLVFKLNHH
ncbi:putative endo-polygalacturonase [Helianthus debilis subsp. tardiflorus]